MAEGELRLDPGGQGDEENLRLLSSFFRPLPPQERQEREQMYRGPGELTREMIARLLAGEFS